MSKRVRYAGKIVAEVYGVCLKCGKRERLGDGEVTAIAWKLCKAILVEKGWRQVGAWGMACPECEGSFRAKKEASA